MDGTLAFPGARFDLIYSVLVLHHLPTRAAIRSTVRELVRTLRPGGLLCFQIPSRLPLRRRWQLRRRLYGVLRATGLGQRVLYERCGLHPIRMNAIAEREVRALVTAAGGRVLACRPDAHAGPELASRFELGPACGGEDPGRADALIGGLGAIVSATHPGPVARFGDEPLDGLEEIGVEANEAVDARELGKGGLGRVAIVADELADDCAVLLLDVGAVVLAVGAAARNTMPSRWQ